MPFGKHLCSVSSSSILSMPTPVMSCHFCRWKVPPLCIFMKDCQSPVFQMGYTWVDHCGFSALQVWFPSWLCLQGLWPALGDIWGSPSPPPVRSLPGTTLPLCSLRGGSCILLMLRVQKSQHVLQNGGCWLCLYIHQEVPSCAQDWWAGA